MIRSQTQIDVSVKRKLAPVDPELIAVLQGELEPTRQELRRRTPVDTGRLRKSSSAHLRETGGGRARIRVGWLFVPYARFVENPKVPPHGDIIRGMVYWLRLHMQTALGGDFVRRLRRRG